MRSTEIDGITFHHNGDFSGDVLLALPHASVINWPSHMEVQIPFSTLVELVGRAMQQATISEIENETGAEFLGFESDD